MKYKHFQATVLRVIIQMTFDSQIFKSTKMFNGKVSLLSAFEKKS